MNTLVAALLIALAPAPAMPDVPPPCDQPDATQCTWDVEIDGTMYTVPGCAEEDGNVDGRPCLWIDPDTGRGFYVNSANYR